MQALHLLALDPVAETTADLNSYGFRRERSCADAMVQCFTVLATKRAPQWVLECDIKACFDRIDHEWLLTHIPMDRVILRKWLKSGYVEKLVQYPTEEGAPQGGPISPVLANLSLDGMERMLRAKYPANSAKGYRAKVNLIRYADDFIVTGSSKELLENEVKPLIAQFLSERGLELSAEKTSITHIEDGFDFLGQNVRKYDGKLIIKPSKASVKAFVDAIRKVVKANKSATAGHLVLQLTPKIKGWAMFHRHACAKQTFGHVDDALFKTLWQWAKRRHPNKNHHWIARKYFTALPGPVGGNQWTFFGEVKASNGEVRPVVLLNASRIPICRHIKLRSDVNPYDPAWKEYLDRRHRRESLQSTLTKRPVKGRSKPTAVP